MSNEENIVTKVGAEVRRLRAALAELATHHEQLVNKLDVAEQDLADERKAVVRLTMALSYIATPRASVDMADSNEQIERDALHALHACRSYAYTALAVERRTEEVP